MNNKKIKIKPYEATQESLYQPYQIATNNMKTKEKELREEFVNWCRFEFSSNEGNQIADWWLEKLRQAIAEERESIKQWADHKAKIHLELESTHKYLKHLKYWHEGNRNALYDVIAHLTQE